MAECESPTKINTQELSEAVSDLDLTIEKPSESQKVHKDKSKYSFQYS